MPFNQVVLDLETQKTFDEVGRGEFAELGVSLVGVYLYESNEYRAFEFHEMSELELLLSKASRIIGFNVNRFDFTVLQPHLKYVKLRNLPTFDILESLEALLGHRVSLQSVSMATLQEGKSGSGLDAIQYFRQKEIEKLKKYCLDDVRLTKEIYEYGKKMGKVHYLSKDSQNRLDIKVDWKDPEPPPNLSLF